MFGHYLSNLRLIIPIVNRNSRICYSSRLRNISKNTLKRTHYCGSLNLENVGQTVTLSGWIQANRLNKFFVLRDVKGTVQILLDDEFIKRNSNQINLNKESVISVRGVVVKRPEGQENRKLDTGLIEVKCDELELLNECKSTLPFEITDINKPNESIRLQYRYLDLRFKEMQQNLIFRSKFTHKIRQYLNEQNFFDIETPTLFKRTPGGAREFIVPTNKSGSFYSLVQSPQQFKQLLMIAGMDKYFQIARCYRDEMTKPDRQPEFTQVDIEMSFVDENDVMNLIESLIKFAWPFLDKELCLPFNRMTFDECMNGYGSDKPDLRFGMKFVDLKQFFELNNSSGISKLDLILKNKSSAYLFKVPREHVDKKFLDISTIETEYKSIFEVTNFTSDTNEANRNKFVFLAFDDKRGNQISKHMSSVFRKNLCDKISLDQNEIAVLLVSSNKLKLLEILGKLRLNLARKIDEANLVENGENAKNSLLLNPNVFNFLWVIDFPLFTKNEETQQLESTHHPFTAPIKEHEVMVKEMENLESIKGLHYDLVLNGSEIAGGK
jgi:aspartyl-tRNA synthetase